VPKGATGAEGAYVDFPLQGLMAAATAEAQAARCLLIGEDLGTVPAGFDTLLAQAGLLGIRVLMFQRDGRRFFRPDEWTPHAIATTTTHDLPTMAGWWAGHDIGWRTKLDLLMPGQSEAEARGERTHERTLLWRAPGGCRRARGATPRAPRAHTAKPLRVGGAAPHPPP